MYDLINYYSVTNNSPIIQFTDNLRHILLVHDDDRDDVFLLFSVMLCVCVYAKLVYRSLHLYYYYG